MFKKEGLLFDFLGRHCLKRFNHYMKPECKTAAMLGHFEGRFLAYAYGVVLASVVMLVLGAFRLNGFSLVMMGVVVALMLKFFAECKEMGVVFKGREKKNLKKDKKP